MIGLGSRIYESVQRIFWTHYPKFSQSSAGLRAFAELCTQVSVPWNLHVPRRGDFRFQGFADVERFLAMAHEADLLVLLNPGPYIGRGWDFGGLPWWLANKQVNLLTSSIMPKKLRSSMLYIHTYIYIYYRAYIYINRRPFYWKNILRTMTSKAVDTA